MDGVLDADGYAALTDDEVDERWSRLSSLVSPAQEGDHVGWCESLLGCQGTYSAQEVEAATGAIHNRITTAYSALHSRGMIGTVSQPAAHVLCRRPTPHTCLPPIASSKTRRRWRARGLRLE